MIPFVRYRGGGRSPSLINTAEGAFGSTGVGTPSGDYTIGSSLSLGGESSDRIILVAWAGDRGASTPILTGIKLGGSAMTLVQNMKNVTGSEVAACCLAYLKYPTGLTADLSITLSGDHFSANLYKVWRLTGAIDQTPYDSDGDNTSEASGTSVTINTASKGAIVAVTSGRGAISSVTWSDLTKSGTDTIDANAFQSGAYEINTAPVSGRTVTVTDDGGSNPRALSALSWK